MDAFRKIVAVVTAIALAFTFVGLGFVACTLPPVTHALSSAFSRDDISPFDRNQLVKVADATRDYLFGAHNELALYRMVYEVDEEYAKALADKGGIVPAEFPAMGAVRDGSDVSQYKAAFNGASEMYCYSQQTISHLDDCYAIAAAAYPALIAIGLIALAGLVFTHVTGSARRTGVVLFGAGAGVVVVLALLAVWAIIDFNGLFTVFHQLFFAQQGNWTFPYDSLLICSLPEAFWMGMGVVWVVSSLVLSGLSAVIGGRLKSR